MADVGLEEGPIFVDVGKGTEQYQLNDDLGQDVMDQGKEEVKSECPETSGDDDDEVSEKKTNKKSDEACLLIQSRRVRCPECHRYTAENEEKMLRHIKKVHRGENPFQCYMCDYSTYNKSLFEEHVRIHQGIKPYKCSQCQYRSVSKKNLKKHELIHRPNNPLKCPDCDFIGRHPRSLKCHMESHNGGGRKLKCGNCKFKCSDVATLQDHEKCHVSHCKDCGHVASSKHLLKKHVLKEHGDKSVKKDQLFSCQVCKWSSSHKPRILLHLIHHPEQVVDENIVDISILRKFEIMT